MKKTVRSLIALAMAAVMLLGLVGCGLTAQEEQVDENTLVIQVESKGYGSQFARDLAEAYNAKNTGIRAVVLNDANSGGFASTALSTNTPVDVFFTIQNTVFQVMSGTEKNKWADLSDIYSSPLVGYAESGEGVTVADGIEDFFVESFTYHDGKQYAVPWTAGFGGFMYNKTRWDKTNENLKAAGQAPLEMPVTTNEMFALFDRMQEQSVKEASNGAYVFTCSSDASGYLTYLFGNWYSQYAGREAAYNFLQGKDENGVYTADIFKSDARIQAYDVMAKLLSAENGYTKLESNFQKMQRSFIKGTAMFSTNGDWMENEVSSDLNPGDANIEFVRIPVISSIVNADGIAADFTGTDAEKEAKLITIINYIDQNNLSAATAEAAGQLGVSENTLQRLIEARLVQYCTPSFCVVVPSYSDQMDAAKDFIKFMLSKEGQEIFMKSTYGIGAPLSVDMTQFDYYANSTTLSKSKLNLLQNSIMIGDEGNSYPMQYISGGLKMTMMDMINEFAGSKIISSETMALNEYEHYKALWEDMMKAAGVKNN